MVSKDFKEISVAEFFEKNRHLLGFDSKRKALYVVVKEAVDNSLDACEEHRILPDIIVRVQRISGEKFKVTVEDNGPGIPNKHVPKVFGKFLYGTKFHKFKQTRGQQGIGISAVTLYSQLTTGEPTTIISKYINEDDAYLFRIFIDVRKNEPKVVEKKKVKWTKDHGLSVNFILEAQWSEKVYEYLKYTAIANPYARIILYDPNGQIHIFKRKINEMPEPPKEIKPHPHGVEFGLFKRMVEETKRRTLRDFLTKDFSSVGEKVAYFIVYKAFINPKAEQEWFDPNKLSKSESKEIEKILSKNPKEFTKEDLEKIWTALQEAKLRRPPVKILRPIGAKNLEKSLSVEFEPDFVCAIERKPAVYRGIPFKVEVGIAYGGKVDKFRLIRLANKVPLLYEQGSCAITKAVEEIDWKRYEIPISGKFPNAPLVLVVHISSIWIPYTSESKMAIASYPEIVKEVKYAIMEAARKLAEYLRKRKSEEEIGEKYRRFVIYGLESAKALALLLNESEEKIREDLVNVIIRRALNDFIQIIASELKKKVNIQELTEKIIKKMGKDKIVELFGKGKIKELRKIIMGELV